LPGYPKQKTVLIENSNLFAALLSIILYIKLTGFSNISLFYKGVQMRMAIAPRILSAVLMPMLLFTIANAQVSCEWIAIHDGQIPNSFDTGNDIAVDSAGNIYITGITQQDSGKGYDITTLKYSPSGQILWQFSDNILNNSDDRGLYLALDGWANVYFTGSSTNNDQNSQIITYKCDSNGRRKWTACYKSPQPRARPFGIAVDSHRHVYICGTSPSDSSDGDFVLMKYDSSGVLLWDNRIYGHGGNVARATGLAIDADDNIYTTGWFRNENDRTDFITVKYNPAGQQIWQAIYANPDNGYSFARSICLDSAGNVYVAGDVTTWSEVQLFQTVKYNNNGEFQWARTHNGYQGQDDNGDNVINASLVSPNGDQFMVGSSFRIQENQGLGHDFATLKYNASGDLGWTSFYNNGIVYSDNFINDIARDPKGNIYVTGSSLTDYYYGTDFTTIKYDTSGRQQWIQRYYSNIYSDDAANAIAVDNQGNIIITGRSENNIVTVKYSQSSDIKFYSNTNPSSFEISNIYPNPFNSSTTISFDLDTESEMIIEIYDILGRKVSTLADKIYSTGRHQIIWCADNTPSGLYFCRVKTPDLSKTAKLILIK
jgi:uncharacterized delta-60 repeat protein